MIFKYDPGIARAEFEQHGYAHLKNILSDSFRNYLIDYFNKSASGEVDEISNRRIYGKKRQFLFDFPSHDDAIEFRGGIADLTGVDRDLFTISERHLYIYERAAIPWPAPHKDRAASQISIGLPIHFPEGSTACVFPEIQFGPNDQERAVYLSEPGHCSFEQFYQTEKAIRLNETIGDLILFLGSSLFHARVKSGGTAIVYIKVNSRRSDPLGEDIFAGK